MNRCRIPPTPKARAFRVKGDAQDGGASELHLDLPACWRGC